MAPYEKDRVCLAERNATDVSSCPHAIESEQSRLYDGGDLLHEVTTLLDARVNCT